MTHRTNHIHTSTSVTDVNLEETDKEKFIKKRAAPHCQSLSFFWPGIAEFCFSQSSKVALARPTGYFAKGKRNVATRLITSHSAIMKLLLWSCFLMTLPMASAFVTPRPIPSVQAQLHRSLHIRYDSNSSDNNDNRGTSAVAPEVLATEGDWSAYLDAENTGLVYYFNKQTGQAVWEPPTDTFPVIKLRGSNRRQAREKQMEYVKTAQEQQKRQEKQDKGFFSGLLDGTERKRTETTAEKEEPNWFGNIFEDVVEKQQKQPEPKKQAVKEPSSAVEEEQVVEAEEEQLAAPAAEAEEAERAGFFRGLFAPRAEEAIVTEEPPPAEIITPVEVEKPIKINMSSYVLAHPAKRFWGGEDAVFTKGRTFGVFDGVSGANKLDGLPLYSRTLANVMKEKVGNDGLTIKDLTDLLTQAAETADKKATGASTAIVASISEDGYLRALNIGDSACIVVRNGKVVGKTREISHYFECPYQLSTDSPDRPKDGTRLNLELMRGDLVFMASDGIFDNMSDQDIVDAIMSSNPRPSDIAKKVSDVSRRTSFDQKAPTPYAATAKRFGDPDFKEGLGGKVDDISCVVVRYE